MKKDRKNKIFKFLIVFLFVIYMTIYVSQLTGYYEFKNYQKTTLTKEQISKFEDDVKNGKNVKLTDYVVNTNKHYQTRLKKMGYDLSEFISKMVNKGINSSFDFLIKLVDE